ncbi:MAG: nitrous oxide reductase accessory protein NosL [Thermodesulfovibrio sp.]|nr:nitrous oxide reductase accessory protein NosL [Thermodesulfovibrio sp.]
MKKRCILPLCIAGILLTASLSFGADKKPVEVKKTDKCQVCGMFVAKYKEWVAQIIFADGTYAVFDGPKDMLRFYFNPQKYNPAKKQSDIQMLYVTEYYSTKLMDARKLFYVSGSNVTGPMGAELVPLESEQKAKEFLKDHNGKKVLKFSEITVEVLD